MASVFYLAAQIITVQLLAAVVATLLFEWLLDERSVESSMPRVRESAP